jgi:hypothetical protein
LFFLTNSAAESMVKLRHAGRQAEGSFHRPMRPEILPRRRFAFARFMTCGAFVTNLRKPKKVSEMAKGIKAPVATLRLCARNANCLRPAVDAAR